MAYIIGVIARGPCTLWPSVNGRGYGVVRVGRRATYVHIVSFVATYGEYDRALVLDHLCGHAACFDPSHLEAVTFAENARRGQQRRWALAKGQPDPFYDPTPVSREERMELPCVPTAEDIMRWAPRVAAASGLRVAA